MEQNKKALVRIDAEGRDIIEVAGDDVLMEMEVWGRTMGYVAMEMQDDGESYLIKWYSRGVDGASEFYCDPVILAEGHIEDGDIQRLLK